MAPDPRIWSLVRVGRRVVNVARLVLSEEAPEGVRVTLDAGTTFLLKGPDAIAWRRALATFVPDRPEGGGGTVDRTVVVRD